MKVNIGVSARHVHLSRNDLDILCFDFYEEYENKIEKASSYYFFNEYQRNKKYI